MADIEKVEQFNISWIKLFRKFTEWEWYKDSNTKSLFLHCLLKANFKNKKWQGQEIERGQFVSSHPKLSFETGLTVRQIRTSINRLKTTGEVSVCTTARYSIITVKNYNEYQEDDRLNVSQTTGSRQARDRLTTTTNNEKNEKNENNSNKEKENFKKNIIKDIYYDERIINFLKSFKIITKKSSVVSPDERKKILDILNDLINQEKNIENETKKCFENFNKIDFKKIKYTPTIHWLLKEDNFYEVLDGAYNFKNKTADTIADNKQITTKRKTASQMTDEERNAQIIKELTESGENPDEYFD